jgi:hypothetical protein
LITKSDSTSNNFRKPDEPIERRFEMKQRKQMVVFFSGLVILAIAAGISAFSFITNASAGAHTDASIKDMTLIGGRGPRNPGDGPVSAEFLASALGITVDELQTAQQNAFGAAVQEALDKGLITKAQADRLSDQSNFPRHGLNVLLVGPDSGIDMDALLAKELGITVDKLQEARAQASSDSLAQSVEDGMLTQEQADLIKARQVLRDYIDPNTLQAKALGISTDQLNAYHDQGLRMPEILHELGLTETEVSEAYQSAFKAAISKAVNDGVITQTQADLVLNTDNAGMPFGHQPGFGPRGDRGSMGPGGLGGFGAPDFQPPVESSGTGL